ncbi:MAG: hypothetical protein AAF985_08800 [Bacteroidota bacterium]
MKAKILLFGFFFFALGWTTQAQTATPKVKDRQINQQKRIHQGVKSGELTKRETIRLQQQQASVQRTKKRAKADGVVTKRERAVIHKKQNKANKNIRRAKHNNRSRN